MSNFYQFKKHLALIPKLRTGNLFRWLPNRRVVDATRLKRWDAVSLMWAIANISNLPQYWFKYHSRLTYNDDFFHLLAVVMGGKSVVTTISPKTVGRLAVILGTQDIYKDNKVAQRVEGKWQVTQGTFVDKTKNLTIVSRCEITKDAAFPEDATHVFLTLANKDSLRACDYNDLVELLDGCAEKGVVVVVCASASAVKALSEYVQLTTIKEINDPSTELKPELKFADAELIFIPKS